LLYVLISEVLILVPSLGRYHRSLLEARVESSEIAINSPWRSGVSFLSVREPKR